MALSRQFSPSELPPFRIAPRFVSRVWGCRDLRPWYDHATEGGEPIGEVWLTGNECVIETGPYAGKTLGGLFYEAPDAMLGTAFPSPESPLLVKVIFAREKLSVQVHPDDRMARRYGQPHGKTECWYALAAEPGAQVAAGLKPGVTLDQIKTGIETGTLEASLNVLPVAAGDMILVDAGTVHAIWPGSILLEIQQNSDVTYRMYDYGRPRELHIEKSLEATKLVTRAGKVPARMVLNGAILDRTVLVDEDYFRVERIPVAGSRAGSSLRGQGEPALGLSYLFAAAGAGRITGQGFEPVDLPPHGIVAVPAASPEFAVAELNGLDLIRMTPKWPGRIQ
jgi:mannose-6-phosphate isomerase